MTSSIAARFDGSAAAARFATSTGSRLEQRLDDLHAVGAERAAGLGDVDDRVDDLGHLRLGGAEGPHTFTAMPRSPKYRSVRCMNSVEMRVPGGISRALFATCSFGTASTTRVPCPVPLFAYDSVARTSTSALGLGDPVLHR